MFLFCALKIFMIQFQYGGKRRVSRLWKRLYLINKRFSLLGIGFDSLALRRNKNHLLRGDFYFLFLNNIKSPPNYPRLQYLLLSGRKNGRRFPYRRGLFLSLHQENFLLPQIIVHREFEEAF